MPTAISYTGADRYRNTNSRSSNAKDEESRLATKLDEDGNRESSKAPARMEESETNGRLADNEFLTLTMVTRGTSPTPPASSSYVRNRRAESGIVHQREVTRSRKLPDTTDKEAQCERMEESSRFSRFGGGNRVSGTPWSTYLDKYSSSGATSAGNPSVYSSRGFNNVSSSSARINSSFAYTRTNETPVITRNEFAAKESSGSSQEIHSYGNRSQSERVFGGSNCAGIGNESSSASSDSKVSSSGQGSHDTDKESNEGKAQSNEQCFCGVRKTETSRTSRTSNQDLAFHRKEDSTIQSARQGNSDCEDQSTIQSPVRKCDEYNQRRPSVTRMGGSSSKNEVKVPKSSSKIDSPKAEVYERRGSTPKSDVSSSSRTEESPRIVEGLCQDQNEEVTSHRRDASQRKGSASRYVNLFLLYLISIE